MLSEAQRPSLATLLFLALTSEPMNQVQTVLLDRDLSKNTYFSLVYSRQGVLVATCNFRVSKQISRFKVTFVSHNLITCHSRRFAYY